MFKSLKWEDWMGVALGVILLVSPWALGYSAETAATMNALVMGVILVLEEMLELGLHETAEEWIDLAAGAWLIASPFVLGFASVPSAAASAIVVGALTVLFALMAMSSLDEKMGLWWKEHVVH